MKKILLITSFFPPSANPGIYRNVKLIKYLHNHNYNFVVLTFLLEIDPLLSKLEKENLLQELPQNIKVKRIKPFPRERIENILGKIMLSRLIKLFYLPDGEIFDGLKLLREGIKICQKEKIELLYISGPPFATKFIVAMILKKLFKFLLIIDFRDPWVEPFFAEYETIFHYWVNKYLEKKALEVADGIIVVSPRHKEKIELSNPFVHKKVVLINNGYDEEDFKENIKENRTDKFYIVYTGEFYSYRPIDEKRYKRVLRKIYNLGKYYPYQVGKEEINTHTPYYFFQAIKLLFEKYPHLREKIKVIIAGRRYEVFKKLAEKWGIEKNISFLGQVSHKKVIQLLLDADLLLYVLLAKSKGNRSAYCIPGKTYEYIRSGKPILALVPEGDAKEILEKAGTAYFADPTSPEEIADLLERLYQLHCQGGIPVQPNWEFIQQFERSRQAKKLAEFLDQIFEQAKNPSNQ